MNQFPLKFRSHAVQQMIRRGITEVDVREVVEAGDVIENYPDDLPYPSRLMLGWPSGRPVHVLAADDPDAKVTVIITAYEPDPRRWTNGFRTRR